MGTTRSEAPASVPERVAFPISEFCFRNRISRATYHRLRTEGRGPVEMRIGLNLIRITVEAERDWQRAMQVPRADLEPGCRACCEGRQCRGQKLQPHQQKAGSAPRSAATSTA